MSHVYPMQLLQPAEPVAVITLYTRAPRKKVVWTEDTVDNEHMNKKKSKCCCIYEKPRRFEESDSEDSGDECEHCFGHVEKRKAKQRQAAAAGATADVQNGPTPEPTTTVTLRPDEPPPAPAPPDKDNPSTSE